MRHLLTLLVCLLVPSCATNLTDEERQLMRDLAGTVEHRPITLPPSTRPAPTGATCRTSGNTTTCDQY